MLVLIVFGLHKVIIEKKRWKNIISVVKQLRRNSSATAFLYRRWREQCRGFYRSCSFTKYNSVNLDFPNELYDGFDFDLLRNDEYKN